MELLDFITVAGPIFGLVGFILGVLNFLRDRHEVEVSLQWDMNATPNSGYEHTKKWGVITITNVGRRPIYVSHVAIKLPRGLDNNYLLISEGLVGKKLLEGDPSAVYVVSQDGLNKYSTGWAGMTAQVTDSSGKVWRSKNIAKKPSWVIQN